MRRDWFQKLSLSAATQSLLVFVVAFALKQHYSTASVNELRWILAPTAWLVQLVTGDTFAFESHAGYMSSDHTFLIAASCAGVNFLITAFLMLSLRKLWVSRAKIGWSFIPIAAVVAYFATILANTFRILVALQIRSIDSSTISRSELHRFEGIFVYFGFLFLLFVVTERTTEGSTHSRNQKVGSFLESMRNIFMKSCFPLVIYYATTLALPLANAVYRGGSLPAGFWKHFVFVVVTPLLLLLSFAIVRGVGSSFSGGWKATSFWLGPTGSQSGRGPCPR